MKRLLELRLEFAATSRPTTGYEVLRGLAENEGLRFDAVRPSAPMGGRVDMSELVHQVRTAHGYWIRDGSLLRSPEIREAVEGRLKEGAIAIAQVPMPETPVFDGHPPESTFLADHGLEGSSVRLVQKGPREAGPFLDDMVVTAEYESYPFGFRDPTLFKGVRALYLTQANALGCFQEAQPVLAIPAGAVRLLDIRRDRFFAEISRPEFPVIASSARDDWRGRMIGLSASVLFDPYIGISGHKFLGISGLDNLKLARNLMRVVALGQQDSGPSWPQVFSLISQIETAIARTTRTLLLRDRGSEWFQACVPEVIRTKCAQRLHSENASLPVEAYLDLIDFKKIWNQEWSVVEVVIAALTPAVAKKEVLSAMQRANDLRKPAMHPTKQVYGSVGPPREEDMDFLRKVATLFDRIHQASQAAGNRAGN